MGEDPTTIIETTVPSDRPKGDDSAAGAPPAPFRTRLSAENPFAALYFEETRLHRETKHKLYRLNGRVLMLESQRRLYARLLAVVCAALVAILGAGVYGTLLGP